LQCSSNNSSKRRKNGAKQNTISDIDSVMDNVDFDEDFVEEVNMKSLDAAECDSSTISTHGKFIVIIMLCILCLCNLQ
jgi:hypothetical protein